MIVENFLDGYGDVLNFNIKSIFWFCIYLFSLNGLDKYKNYINVICYLKERM